MLGDVPWVTVSLGRRREETVMAKYLVGVTFEPGADPTPMDR